MGSLNQEHNRAVWCDIPVADLARANAFYAAVLAIKVTGEEFGDVRFSILEHGEGNGACLVPRPEEVSADKGILVYFNAEGRIRHAVEQVKSHGGSIVEEVNSIGPHGFRAIVLDSEGNRIALHSNVDQ
jgi:predicted enzyme related to lactoylglutathione lyase